jgi:hypothetical protein
MTRYRVSFEKTLGNGKPFKTATEVYANSVEEAERKVISTHGSATNVEVKIIEVIPLN